MDGIGLGVRDPKINPIAQADMPNMSSLLGGDKLVAGKTPIETQGATLLAIDPVMGVEGRPQSATGQAALLTGKNVAKIIGGHYGPKPNPPVTEVIRAGTVFSALEEMGFKTALLNAYPERYFDAIASGKRLFSAIPLAVTSAGVELKTVKDLYAGEALSVDFTGQGWRDHLGYDDIPLLDPHTAGHHLSELAASYDFAFFEYWPSDFAGHRQDKKAAIELLENFDQVLGGLLEAWDHQSSLILITSDHGNMEDLSVRSHTMNPVPALVIGSPELRQKFASNLKTLADVAPAILKMYKKITQM